MFMNSQPELSKMASIDFITAASKVQRVAQQEERRANQAAR